MSLKFVLAVVGAVIALQSHAQGSAVVTNDLVGKWRCGPTVMRGPNVIVTASEEIIRADDGSFVSHGTSMIEVPGKPPLTIQDKSDGSWELTGEVLKTHIQHLEFLSSSEVSITKEMGQKVEDDQLAKKSIYENRVLEHTGMRYRVFPVNPMHKEAAVETSCERT